jgi:hypothetical protein
MSRVRRVKPSTREGRRRAAELQHIIRRARSSKAEREEARKELDVIAPVEGSGFVWNPIGAMGPKPDTVALLSLCDRVDAKRGGSSCPAGGPAGLEEFLARMLSPEQKAADRERVIRRAEDASDVERAAALLEELPDHPLNKMAREIGDFLVRENSHAGDSAVQIAAWTIRDWLERQPYNRADLHGSAETVSDAVDDAYRLLDEREANDPAWYIRRMEQCFDNPEPAVKPEPQLAKAPEPVQRVEAETEPDFTPVQRAQMDLEQMVNLILGVVDAQWLGRLAQSSPVLDGQIRGAIAEHLTTYGGCDGVFLAQLFNTLRPHSSAFPQRTL